MSRFKPVKPENQKTTAETQRVSMFNYFTDCFLVTSGALGNYPSYKKGQLAQTKRRQ
jgi:hypothetical protein